MMNHFQKMGLHQHHKNSYYRPRTYYDGKVMFSVCSAGGVPPDLSSQVLSRMGVPQSGPRMEYLPPPARTRSGGTPLLPWAGPGQEVPHSQPEPGQEVPIPSGQDKDRGTPSPGQHTSWTG